MGGVTVKCKCTTHLLSTSQPSHKGDVSTARHMLSKTKVFSTITIEGIAQEDRDQMRSGEGSNAQVPPPF